VLGEEVIEPQWPAIGVGDSSIGRAVAGGRSRHYGAVLLDDWAAPVIDSDPGQAFAYSLFRPREAAQQRHQVIAYEAADGPMQRYEPRRPIGLADHRLVDRLALNLIAVEELRSGSPVYDMTEFPGEIERVLNAPSTP